MSETEAKLAEVERMVDDASRRADAAEAEVARLKEISDSMTGPSKIVDLRADLGAALGEMRQLLADNARLRARLADADEIIDDCWHQFAIDIRGKLSPGGLSTLEMVDDYRNERDGAALADKEGT